MSSFSKGDRCQGVEYDPDTGEPKTGGRIIPAVVEAASAAYVQARMDGGSIWVFHQGSGWGATPELDRWRLEPVPDAASILSAMAERDRMARDFGHMRDPGDVPRLIGTVNRVLGAADGVEKHSEGAAVAARLIRDAVMRGLTGEETGDGS